MSTHYEDERTEDQRKTHLFAVAARDKSLSGWGGARGKTSLAAWAIGPGVDSEKLLAWVESRSEMRNVRKVRLSDWRPRNAHVHVYVTGPDHPSQS